MAVAAITVIVVMGATYAYNVGIGFQTKTAPQQEFLAQRRSFEGRVTQLLKFAFLSSDQTSTRTFFIASTNGENPIVPTTEASAQLPDTLTFTSIGQPPSGGYVDSLETFDTLNEQYGPQGGVSEYSISLVPVGDAGDRTGLFLRRQSPSDGDYTQGGFESVLNEDVSSIGFEFYDGTTWATEWDTNSGGEKRLPSAVRVTYTLTQDENVQYVFVVRLEYSDVTPENPAGQAGGTDGGQG